MRYCLPLLSLLVISSCATILNSKHCKTDLRTNIPISAVIGVDTIALKPRQSNVIVSERTKAPKEIILLRDEVIDTVVLISRWSPVYYLNFATYGYGFVIDGSTPKKWAYPDIINLTDSWIEKHSSVKLAVQNRYAGKGAVNLRLGYPYLNWFNANYGADKRSHIGFLGASYGLDYFYGDKMFLNISICGIMNAFIPFPAPVHFEGIKDHMYSGLGIISINHMLKNNRFSIGYGITFGRYHWNTINHGRWNDDAAEEEIKRKSVFRASNSLGFAVPFYYYTKRSFYMGIVYRPMLLQFTDKTRFAYQHTASFEFGWRIRL